MDSEHNEYIFNAVLNSSPLSMRYNTEKAVYWAHIRVYEHSLDIKSPRVCTTTLDHSCRLL